MLKEAALSLGTQIWALSGDPRTPWPGWRNSYPLVSCMVTWLIPRNLEWGWAAGRRIPRNVLWSCECAPSKLIIWRNVFSGMWRKADFQALGTFWENRNEGWDTSDSSAFTFWCLDCDHQATISVASSYEVWISSHPLQVWAISCRPWPATSPPPQPLGEMTEHRRRCELQIPWNLARTGPQNMVTGCNTAPRSPAFVWQKRCTQKIINASRFPISWMCLDHLTTNNLICTFSILSFMLSVSCHFAKLVWKSICRFCPRADIITQHQVCSRLCKFKRRYHNVASRVSARLCKCKRRYHSVACRLCASARQDIIM